MTLRDFELEYDPKGMLYELSLYVKGEANGPIAKRFDIQVTPFTIENILPLLRQFCREKTCFISIKQTYNEKMEVQSLDFYGTNKEEPLLSLKNFF